MAKRTIKWHKWVSWLLSFVIILFALSGILLNHRKAIAPIDLPRSILPPNYRYERWNNGAFTGTIKEEQTGKVWLFGSAGVWSSDTTATHFTDANRGLPKGVDRRTIRGMAHTSSQLWLITPYHLYHHDGVQWCEEPTIAANGEDFFTDLIARGDSLLLLSRSQLFIRTPHSLHYDTIQLQAPHGYQNRVSLFRTIWLLHSGALFGMVGRIVVDLIALILLSLIVTGLLISFYRIQGKRQKERGEKKTQLISRWISSLKQHNWVGKIFLPLLLLVTITGMFLRPPLLIAIVRARIPAIRGTSQYSSNPWQDKLRKIRYDEKAQEWMLATSEGIFRFPSFNARPQKVEKTPPISVMGLTVWQQKPNGNWIMGSFSGIYEWNPSTSAVIDYVQRTPYTPRKEHIPNFDNAITGFSNDFSTGEVVIDYHRGASYISKNRDFSPMPQELEAGKISLWQVALEVHVGRIFEHIIKQGNMLYPFLGGGFLLVSLLTGYTIYRKKYRKRSKHSRSQEKQAS